MLKNWSVLLLCCLSFNIQAEAVFRVAYENDLQFPYYLGRSSAVPTEKPGTAVELVKLLETKIPGLKIELVRYPWSRCLLNLKRGLVDGIFNASYLEKRLRIGRYPLKNGVVDASRRLTTIAYYFYKPKGGAFNWDGKTINDRAMVVAAPLKYSIVNDLNNMKVNVLEVHTSVSTLNKLVHKLVEVAALQEVTGDYYLNHYPQFKGLVKVKPVIKVKPYYLMISHQYTKKHPQLIETIWDSVAELREDELPRLTKKYIK